MIGTCCVKGVIGQLIIGMLELWVIIGFVTSRLPIAQAAPITGQCKIILSGDGCQQKIVAQWNISTGVSFYVRLL